LWLSSSRRRLLSVCALALASDPSRNMSSASDGRSENPVEEAGEAGRCVGETGVEDRSRRASYLSRGVSEWNVARHSRLPVDPDVVDTIGVTEDHVTPAAVTGSLEGVRESVVTDQSGFVGDDEERRIALGWGLWSFYAGTLSRRHVDVVKRVCYSYSVCSPAAVESNLLFVSSQPSAVPLSPPSSSTLSHKYTWAQARVRVGRHVPHERSRTTLQRPTSASRLASQGARASRITPSPTLATAGAGTPSCGSPSRWSSTLLCLTDVSCPSDGPCHTLSPARPVPFCCETKAVVDAGRALNSVA
jgi:hypothetical protein